MAHLLRPLWPILVSIGTSFNERRRDISSREKLKAEIRFSLPKIFFDLDKNFVLSILSPFSLELFTPWTEAHLHQRNRASDKK
jgi:hypothetical protein